MSTTKPEIRYEDAAEFRTGLQGWVCKTCSRFWGDTGVASEHMARYCCSTDRPCECGGRCEKHRTCCSACRRKHEDERWASLKRIDWDGETPLCDFDGDGYYFDEDTLISAIEYHIEEGGTIEDFCVVLCEPNNGRWFEMIEFLQDDFAPDSEPSDLDTRDIDKLVNDWIKAHAPYSWSPTNVAISIASLKALMPDPS